MKPKHFIDKLDDARIIAAIGAAEQKTSGEIRVYISHQLRREALAAARARFFALGMHKTRLRNAVLIYLVPRAHQFALWGDVGVHEKCGEIFWTEISGRMAALLKNELLTEAVEHAVKEVGAALARFFPRESGDSNQLPNEIGHD